MAPLACGSCNKMLRQLALGAWGAPPSLQVCTAGGNAWRGGAKEGQVVDGVGRAEEERRLFNLKRGEGNLTTTTTPSYQQITES